MLDQVTVLGESAPIRAALMLAVESDKVLSTADRLDVRDVHITPIPPGASEWFDGTDPRDDPAGRVSIDHLIEGFARGIGARREARGGHSWIGDELLLRLHKRSSGGVSLDISCHWSRLSADIR